MRFTLILIVVLAFFAENALIAADARRDRRVDDIFSAYDRKGSPGCSLGVIRDGDFIYRRNYGMASLELASPLSSDSVFYMASVAKQFTAASVVLASEKGLLSLDDNVRKYIPELPDYGHPITLREMLHHTSGLRDFETLLYLSGRSVSDFHSNKEIFDLITREKGLNSVPGDQYIYSNTNYFLLGEVIERVSRQSLAQFAEENIFRPLGMSHTRFYDDHRLVVPGRVAAYDPTPEGKFLVDWSTNFDLVGAGGLMSTVDDLRFWDRNFYQNRLGRGTLVEQLLTPGVLNDGHTISYALGLELGNYRGLSTVEHGGALFGYRTDILRFPEQRFSVICLCNSSSAVPDALAHRVADVYLGDSLKNENREHTRVARDPTAFAGTYLDEKTHLVYTFSASGGSLMGWGATLRRLGSNQFKDLGTGIITFEESGSATNCRLTVGGETFFSGKRIRRPHLSFLNLSAYAGHFYSGEIDASYQVSVNDDALVLVINGRTAPLHPVAADEFVAESLGTILFRRDSGRRVNGLKVFAVNARGVEFNKVP